MLSDGLVDELHLFVFRLTMGSRLRLFPDAYPETKLALRDVESYDSQVVQLTYAPGD
jgi:dihydrofolate reductase